MSNSKFPLKNYEKGLYERGMTSSQYGLTVYCDTNLRMLVSQNIKFKYTYILKTEIIKMKIKKIYKSDLKKLKNKY